MDLRKKDIAMKIQWIFKIGADPLLAAMSKNMLKNEMGELLWLANLQRKDVYKMFPQEHFWTHLLKIWAEFKNKVNNVIDPAEQIIWYNSLVRIGGKPVFYKD